jgi:hypothetical protein
MPVISKPVDYDGFNQKVERLSLRGLVDEAIATLTAFPLLIEERRHANGTRGLRQTIDEGFERLGGWNKITVGGIDWSKTGPTGACVGVEVQVSGRSDMLAVDIMHLRDSLVDGTIDVGVIIVPDNPLSRFLTDRTPNFSTAIKHVEHRAKDLAILVVAFMHDGPGGPLEKMRTNLGKL